MLRGKNRTGKEFAWRALIVLDNLFLPAGYADREVEGSPGVEVNLQRSEVRYREAPVEVGTSLYLPKPLPYLGWSRGIQRLFHTSVNRVGGSGKFTITITSQGIPLKI
ncbi:hypothetical protein DFH07DRAFT_764420 [Mycena maculata]|uniref:Uncharacterized protein n=1 Tax=Mycena maculata TaxID=230809 RepID=A0AAD7NZJ4_9AGAR|nr:hypothetical protein DFH07DRAFT_764420 [Mycena maculata]